MANPKNLPADLLAYMQSLQAPTQYGQNGAQYTRDGLMPVFNQSWAASPETGQGPSGDGSLMSIVGPGRNPEENAEFDPQTGEFKRYYTVKDEFMGMNPLLAFALATGGLMSIPALGGAAAGAGAGTAAGEAAGGLLSGAEGAGSMLGGAAGDTLGAGVFNAAADSQLANLALGSEALAGYGAAGSAPVLSNFGTLAGNTTGVGNLSGGLFGEATPSVFNAAKDSQLANELGGLSAVTSGGASNPLIAGIDAMTGNASGINKISNGFWSDLLGESLGKYAPNIISSVLGAAGSKDQTKTARTDPWEPAQPWMKDNIAKGQDLQKFYENNPFNDVQKGALQGLLDVSNTGTQALPSLLDFANRMGQSNYQRSGGRNLAYSAPSTATPRGVMPTGLSAAAPIDWASMNPFARKA